MTPAEKAVIVAAQRFVELDGSETARLELAAFVGLLDAERSTRATDETVQATMRRFSLAAPTTMRHAWQGSATKLAAATLDDVLSTRGAGPFTIAAWAVALEHHGYHVKWLDDQMIRTSDWLAPYLERFRKELES